MIYDINGNVLDGTTTETSVEYDYWLNAPNLNGTKGFLKNMTLDSSGNLKSGNGFAVSGFLPLETLLKIHISDMSKVNKSTSKIYFFKEDKTYYSKKTLTEMINVDGSIDGSKYNGMPYMVLVLALSNFDISVTFEYPKEKNRVDNDWFHSFWKNTEYDKTDYTYTEMTHYGTLIENDVHFPANRVRQPKPAYFEIPNKGDFDSYVLYLATYPDMSDAKQYSFEVYREYLGITNLEINKTYWVKIVGIKDNEETEIAFYSYDTEGLVRQIGLVTNMRDIGGHKTEKWGTINQGRIYRSAKLDGYSQNQANALKTLVLMLKLI